MTLMAWASNRRVLIASNTDGATQMGALGIENKVRVALWSESGSGQNKAGWIL